MIGYPDVMMLDECTTGLDPGARRLVWNVLKPQDIEVPSILMSSHYMDECAALGTRIGIMVDGEIVSTGTLSELYNRYCTSFFVEISFEAHSDDTLSEGLVLRAFQAAGMESTSVYESLPYHIKLQVPIVVHHQSTSFSERDGIMQLGRIFSLLESKKRDLGIKFYSVARMNLEQIFINLSRKQFQADDKFETERLESNPMAAEGEVA
jgi:ABC-type multidrug transport system ATPase subunit